MQNGFKVSASNAFELQHFAWQIHTKHLKPQTQPQVLIQLIMHARKWQNQNEENFHAKLLAEKRTKLSAENSSSE